MVPVVCATLKLILFSVHLCLVWCSRWVLSCSTELCAVQDSCTQPSSPTLGCCRFSWMALSLKQPANSPKTRWLKTQMAANFTPGTFCWRDIWIAGWVFSDSEPGQAVSSRSDFTKNCNLSLLPPTHTGDLQTHCIHPPCWKCKSHLCPFSLSAGWPSSSLNVKTQTQRWRQLFLCTLTPTASAQRWTSCDQLQTDCCRYPANFIAVLIMWPIKVYTLHSKL